MITAAFVLALIIALLAVPFELTFHFQRGEERRSDIAIRWLFGIARIPLKGKRAKPRPVKSRKPKRVKKRAPANKLMKNMLWNARFRYRLLTLVKDLFKSIHIAAFYLHIRLGLDDPADTGRLWALLGPISVLLSSISNATVRLEPEFQAEAVYLYSRGKIRIVPLQVIGRIMAFIVSPITIGAIVTAARQK